MMPLPNSLCDLGQAGQATNSQVGGYPTVVRLDECRREELGLGPSGV
jgi:hypothetical protein